MARVIDAKSLRENIKKLFTDKVCNDLRKDVKQLKEDLRCVGDRSTHKILAHVTHHIGQLLHVQMSDGETSGSLYPEAEGLLTKLELVQEYTWEQLNTGHWKSVPRVWRKVYSYVSMYQALCMSIKEPLVLMSMIKSCDMGLLMGEPILGNLLSRMAFVFHQQQASNSDYLLPAAKKNESEDSEQPRNEEGRQEFMVEKILHNQFPASKFDVNRISCPSLETFVQAFFSVQKPVVLQNILGHWPASGQWSVDYIRKRCGSRTVPIEIGSKYTSEDWTQKLITVAEFIDLYISSNTVRDNGLNQSSTKKGYLAQHQLFQQIPELMDDIRIPEYCYVGASPDEIEVNAWFGPRGTVSPVHYDPKHNLLAQVFGYKIIRVFPPSEWFLLYPHEESSLLFNTSQADIEDEELTKHYPSVARAKYADVVLGPGEVLYMPPKWAHFVKSLSPSFSVSFWFQ